VLVLVGEASQGLRQVVAAVNRSASLLSAFRFKKGGSLLKAGQLHRVRPCVLEGRDGLPEHGLKVIAVGQAIGNQLVHRKRLYGIELDED
jgi:hypothetical protein